MHMELSSFKRCETRSGSSGRDLVLTAEEWKQIQRYVGLGLCMPQTDAGISYLIPYSDEKDPILNLENYRKVFGEYYTHARLWDNMETAIERIATGLDTYADEFIENGNSLVQEIGKISTTQQYTEKVGTCTRKFTFVKNGEEEKEILADILPEIQTAVTQHDTQTKAVSDRIEFFRRTMDNEVVPDLSAIAKAIAVIPFLLIWLHKLIERDYSERPSGCPSDPRHDAIAYINNVANDAVKGVQDLNTVWYSIYICLHNAQSKLSDVTEDLRLLYFKLHLSCAVASWKEVKASAQSLIILFTKIKPKYLEIESTKANCDR